MPDYAVRDPQSGRTLTVRGDSPPTEAELQELFAATAAPTKAAANVSGLDRLLAMVPTVGGMVGSVAGGAPGAAMGGAAGRGYQQLATHARELPGAVSDVAKLLVTQPGATLKGAASGAMQGLKDTGIEAGLQAIYELAGQGVTKALGSGAKAVYRGYLKPSLAKQSIKKGEAVVETALKESLPITKAGEDHAGKVIKELQGEIDGMLKNKPGTVDLSAIANKVRAFAKQKYFKAGKPTADFEAAMKVADDLDMHPAIHNPFAPGSPATTNLSGANAIKRGIDEAVGEANFGVERGAVKTTQKVARRGVREAIEQHAPEVGPLNKRQGSLIDAAKAISRAVGRESNKSPLIGVNTLVAGAYGGQDYARNGDPFVAAAKAAALRAALSPAVASRAAIVAYRLGQMSGQVPANAARVADAAIRAVLAEDQQE